MSKKERFHSPFAELGKVKKQLEVEAEASAKPAPPKPKPKPSEEEDTRTFAEIMGGVPLRKDPRGKPTPAAPPRPTEDDVETLVDLASLVDGDGHLDLDEEALEGSVPGLDRKILRALARGDYPVGATLDLHGLKRPAAREALERFVTDARARKLRAVRVVHGKGLHSEDGIGVLKEAMRSWLLSGKIARQILAFKGARPQDGGGGAVLLLLRR